MAFELPPLPYERDALEPHMSKETLDYHYGKHHQKYVDTLNELTEGQPEANKSLEELIKTTNGKLFNQAAQVWNHTFFWHCLSPNGGGKPSGELAQAIDKQFGSFDDFADQFTKAALGRFGSGWAWLVKKPGGELAIVDTPNAENPLQQGDKPLLTVDVWEHAYYIDYRNARPKFLEHFWKLVNWEFVAKEFAS